MKKGASAFTLVEIIVVITILSVLWTIAFVWFQSHLVQSRDTKRISDINWLSKKIEIEANLKNENPISSYLLTSIAQNSLDDNYGSAYSWSVSIISWINYWVWDIDIALLKEDTNQFLDPITNKGYVFWYIESKYSNMFQISSILESTNTAIIAWNYHKMWNSDLVGLIKSVTDSSKVVENNQEFLPYTY